MDAWGVLPLKWHFKVYGNLRISGTGV